MTDKQFQLAVIERDKVCQKCGTAEGLCAHHVVSRRNARLRHQLKNGITLCVKCHAYAHRVPTLFLDWIIFEWKKTPFKTKDEFLMWKNNHQGEFK